MVITLFGETAIEPGMEEREASVADGVVARAPLTRRFEVLDLVVAVGEP